MYVCNVIHTPLHRRVSCVGMCQHCAGVYVMYVCMNTPKITPTSPQDHLKTNPRSCAGPLTTHPSAPHPLPHPPHPHPLTPHPPTSSPPLPPSPPHPPPLHPPPDPPTPHLTYIPTYIFSPQQIAEHADHIKGVALAPDPRLEAEVVLCRAPAAKPDPSPTPAGQPCALRARSPEQRCPCRVVH